MDFSELFSSIQDKLGDTLPMVLGALVILLVGWFVATILRALATKALTALKLNERIHGLTGRSIDVEKGTGSVIFFAVLLLALIAFFNALKLDMASGSLQSVVDQILGFLPRLIAGGVLFLIAWIIACVLRSLVTKALDKTKLDERLGSAEGTPLGKSLGTIAFWLVILLFLPATLGALELDGLLGPVQGMLDDMLGHLPNIFAAAIIGVVGWFLARILRDIVSNLLSVAGADRLGEKVGLQGTMKLSALVALVVYVFVLVPAMIAALDALKIEAISTPATGILQSFMGAIPNLFAAGIVLTVAWFLSRFVANLLVSLLGGAGFDGLPTKLGLPEAFSGKTTPSALAGKLVVFFVMLFATVEAADLLGFAAVSQIVATMIEFGGQVLLGVGIIGVGFWLAGLAHTALQRGGQGKNAVLAGVVRFSIVGLVLAMGLRAMGLADDIVNLGFGLTLGAVAVAFALSFGLGGREAAGKQMEHWMKTLRGEGGSKA